MFKNQLTQIISLIIFSLVVMMLIRLTLYGFYPDDFANLTTSEFFKSLFMGFRVDVITIFTFSSIFVLILLFIKSPKTRKKTALVWGVFLNIIFILTFSDVLYFDYVHRHISNEILNLGNDLDLIFGIAFGSMLPYTLSAMVFEFGVFVWCV